MQARAQAWSNYKNTNTIKYLTAITPAGAAGFLSRGWGGCVSDKEITMRSGFPNFLQYGDFILADRGFNIAETILKIRHITKWKSQMSGKEVDNSRKISKVRIFRMLKESLVESVNSEFYNQLYQFSKCIFLIMLCDCCRYQY